MKDYNFMISDDGLHKTRFCTKRGLTKTFLIKRGVGAKGRLERFRILTGEGGRQKEGATFLRGVSYAGAHYGFYLKIECLVKLAGLR